MKTRLSDAARQFVRENILGRRGLIKMNSLWLPLGLVLLDSNRIRAGRLPGQLAWLGLAVICCGLSATSLNDLVERSLDRAAGKVRWISHLPNASACLMPPLIAAAGLVPLAAAGAPPRAWAVYIGAALLGAAYSVKPARLKERGAWGLAAYGLACATAYAGLPWAWFGGDFAALSVAGTAIFLDKWVNLHFHQIVDYGVDKAQGTATFAVRAGLDAARGALRPATVFASLALATAAFYAAWRHPENAVLVLAVTVGVLGLAAVHAAVSRRRPSLRSALSLELPWPYLGLTLGVLRAVPLVLFLDLARRTPGLWPVFGAVAVLLAADWLMSCRYRYE